MKSLNRVTLGILLCFGIVAISLTYWSVFASDTLLARDDNPRRVEAEKAILRGVIYDHEEQPLAKTEIIDKSISGKPVTKRIYPHPEAASAVGYYSLIYGVGGVEAGFDSVLRGTDQRTRSQTFINDLLHRPQVGGDVKLTLDLDLQSAINAAFDGKQGAAVLLDVPSGAVLAMVSAPSYDPNKLNDVYDTLRTDPASPLLNRATQGLYQPGGALETVILAAQIANQIPGSTPITGAASTVNLKNVHLACAGELTGVDTSNTLTLQQAYALACPGAFVDSAVTQPGAAKLQAIFAAFGLLDAPPVISFETVSGKVPTPLTEVTDPVLLQAQAVGQGDLIVTPLQMVLVAATIANHGNSVRPYLVDAIRSPTSDGTKANWQSLLVSDKPSAVITSDTADSLKAAMLEATTNGSAKAARLATNQADSTPIYGHASIAYTGQTADAWFIGFIDLPNGHRAAIAVVVEQSTSPDAAAKIGGVGLSSTLQQALKQQPH